MRITASRLRADVYKILDRIIESGRPVEILRNGKLLEIALKQPQASPKPGTGRRRAMIGDPEDFVHWNWLGEWREPRR